MTTTYYRGLPARTPAERAAIDALYAVRERLDERYRAEVARLSGRWVQARMSLGAEVEA